MLGNWGPASDRLGVRVKESRETWSRSTEKRRADHGAWGQAAGGALEGALEGLWLGSLELGFSRPPRQDGRQAVAIVLTQGRMYLRGSWEPGEMSFPRQEYSTGTEEAPPSWGTGASPLVAECRGQPRPDQATEDLERQHLILTVLAARSPKQRGHACPKDSRKNLACLFQVLGAPTVLGSRQRNSSLCLCSHGSLPTSICMPSSASEDTSPCVWGSP